MSEAESIVSEAAQGGTLLAYQVGCRYPRFIGVPRETFAAMFEKHGFKRTAKRLRSFTEVKALAHVCSRPGDVASKGLNLVAVKRKEGSHVQAWVISRATETGVEHVEHACGARVFSSPAGIMSDGPTQGIEDPDCRALADTLAARARALAYTVDVSTVSKACTAALKDVAAFPFLSRGSYVLRADDTGARRLVALYRDLRAEFYDNARRAGIQAGVAEITGHSGSENELALSDGVITSAETQFAKLAKQLEKDMKGAGKMRPGTLAKHRDAAQAVLDSLRPVRDLLGSSFERITSLTQGVLDQYKAASTATDLAFPEWIAEGARDCDNAAVDDQDVSPQSLVSENESEPKEDAAPDSAEDEAPDSDPFDLA